MWIEDLIVFKQKALQWAVTFSECCVLDSNGYKDHHGSFDLLIAAGSRHVLKAEVGNAFEQLKSFVDEHKTWTFGIAGYDLKNELEHLISINDSLLGFPDLFFFVPEFLIIVTGSNAQVFLGDESIVDHILRFPVEKAIYNFEFEIKARISKDQYIDAVTDIQKSISRGDVYEVTYCQEFFSENAHLNPVSLYTKLNTLSPAPFSGFLKIEEKYLLSASPERFLSKRGSKLLSQPIKGTAKRGQNATEDCQIKEKFKLNLKERTENVMIVDLVRNDLTKNSVKGGVRVEELFGIYKFPHVFQMISTVSCTMNSTLHIIEALKNAFPMGSMTGAPKIKAMQLIDEMEESKRGAYSGALGYISPEGDFDFSVVIRSLLYDNRQKCLSFHVGGAITHQSIATQEYEECMLKAKALFKALEHERSNKTN